MFDQWMNFFCLLILLHLILSLLFLLKILLIKIQRSGVKCLQYFETLHAVPQNTHSSDCPEHYLSAIQAKISVSKVRKLGKCN